MVCRVFCLCIIFCGIDETLQIYWTGDHYHVWRKKQIIKKQQPLLQRDMKSQG